VEEEGNVRHLGFVAYPEPVAVVPSASSVLDWRAATFIQSGRRKSLVVSVVFVHYCDCGKGVFEPAVRAFGPFAVHAPTGLGVDHPDATVFIGHEVQVALVDVGALGDVAVHPPKMLRDGAPIQDVRAKGLRVPVIEHIDSAVLFAGELHI
jgi:hypothetical protein